MGVGDVGGEVDVMAEGLARQARKGFSSSFI